jgi:predicted TIM-barrel fold metal-dependent hydrolase
MTAKDAPLVDTHFHIYHSGMPLTKSAWHKPPGDAPLERLLELFGAHGIVFGVIAPTSLYGAYSDYMRAALKAHRRLRATCIVDPRTGIYELERMRDDGFVGIRLVWTHLEEPPDLDSDEYRQLFKRVADLDWCVHFTARERHVPHLIATLEKNGIRKIVVDHLGRSITSVNSESFRTLAAAIDRGKTWVKISGAFRFEPGVAEALVNELVRLTDGDRLTFGSDWPFSGFEDRIKYADTINFLKAAVPDERIRRKIGGETPLRLYFT